MIPLLHDLSGEPVLVFGGGTVGARKSRRLAAEARVVVVSPAFSETEFEAEEPRHPDAGVEFVRAAPEEGDLPDWFDRFDPVLVVAATDDRALNDAIEREALSRSVLVNHSGRTGAREPLSVTVPATVRDEEVLLALSTGAPALSKHLRERLEGDLEGVGTLAKVVRELRADLKARGVDPERRRAALRETVRSERVWKVLGTGESNVRRTAADVVSDALGETS